MRLIVLFSIVLSVVVTSCCTFCDIQTSVETVTDTIYSRDTIKVKVLNPVNKEAEESIKFLNESIEALSYELEEWASLNYDSIYGVGEYSTIDSSIHKPKLDSILYNNLFFGSDTSSLYGTYSYSEAWVESFKLFHTLHEADSVIAIIDSLSLVINNNNTTINSINDKSEKYKTKFKSYRRWTIILGAIVLLVVILVVRVIVENILQKRNKVE